MTRNGRVRVFKGLVWFKLNRSLKRGWSNQITRTLVCTLMCYILKLVLNEKTLR